MARRKAIVNDVVLRLLKVINHKNPKEKAVLITLSNGVNMAFSREEVLSTMEAFSQYLDGTLTFTNGDDDYE